MFQLCENDVAELLGGSPPPQKDYFRITFREISDILAAIAELEPHVTEPIRPIPIDKADQAKLSRSARSLLEFGMQGAERVSAYFKTNLDPLKADRIAETFRQKYKEVAAVESDPDIVISELRDFAVGARSGAGREAAAWAVLSYLFERCDIFTVEEITA